MGKSRTTPAAEASKKPDRHRREYVLSTRILGLGGGKSICARKKLQVEFEGCTSSDVETISARDVENMFYGDLPYAANRSGVGVAYQMV